MTLFPPDHRLELEVRVMAYVERCGSVWRALWLLADGVHYGSRSGFATRVAAKRFGEDREAGERRLDRAPDSGLVGPTLEQWWERWLPAQDLAPSTPESYAQQYRRHLRPRWGVTPVGRISSLQVAQFEKDLRERGLASSSVTVVIYPRCRRFAPGCPTTRRCWCSRRRSPGCAGARCAGCAAPS